MLSASASTQSTTTAAAKRMSEVELSPVGWVVEDMGSGFLLFGD